MEGLPPSKAPQDGSFMADRGSSLAMAASQRRVRDEEGGSLVQDEFAAGGLPSGLKDIHGDGCMHNGVFGSGAIIKEDVGTSIDDEISIKGSTSVELDVDSRQPEIAPSLRVPDFGGAGFIHRVDGNPLERRLPGSISQAQTEIPADPRGIRTQVPARSYRKWGEMLQQDEPFQPASGHVHADQVFDRIIKSGISVGRLQERGSRSSFGPEYDPRGIEGPHHQPCQGIEAPSFFLDEACESSDVGGWENSIGNALETSHGGVRDVVLGYCNTFEEVTLQREHVHQQKTGACKVLGVMSEPAITPGNGSLPNPVDKSVSWAAVVSASTSGEAENREGRAKFFQPSIIDGIKVAVCPVSEREQNIKKWDNSLIGYFVGSKPYYFQLKKSVERAWRPIGPLEVLSRENGFYVFRFGNEEDCRRVQRGGPWQICGRMLVTRKWVSGLRSEKELFSKIPMWIRMPNLPLEWWSVDSISRVASVIGLPLRVDLVTSNEDRVSYARCCVEVGLDDELPEYVMLQDECSQVISVKQKIIYEGKTPKCNLCRVFGHASNQCSKFKEKRPMVHNPSQPMSRKVWKPIGGRSSIAKEVPARLKGIEEEAVLTARLIEETTSLSTNVDSSKLPAIHEIVVCHNKFAALDTLEVEPEEQLQLTSKTDGELYLRAGQGVDAGSVVREPSGTRGKEISSYLGKDMQKYIAGKEKMGSGNKDEVVCPVLVDGVPVLQSTSSSCLTSVVGCKSGNKDDFQPSYFGIEVCSNSSGRLEGLGEELGRSAQLDSMQMDMAGKEKKGSGVVAELASSRSHNLNLKFLTASAGSSRSHNLNLKFLTASASPAVEETASREADSGVLDPEVGSDMEAELTGDDQEHSDFEVREHQGLAGNGKTEQLLMTILDSVTSSIEPLFSEPNKPSTRPAVKTLVQMADQSSLAKAGNEHCVAGQNHDPQATLDLSSDEEALGMNCNAASINGLGEADCNTIIEEREPEERNLARVGKANDAQKKSTTDQGSEDCEEGEVRVSPSRVERTEELSVTIAKPDPPEEDYLPPCLRRKPKNLTMPNPTLEEGNGKATRDREQERLRRNKKEVDGLKEGISNNESSRNTRSKCKMGGFEKGFLR